VIGREQISDFRTMGFVVLPDALHRSTVEILRARLDDILGSNKRVVGDKWACRSINETSRFKHIINCWKCDPAIAAILTDLRLGKAVAALGGWSGARLSSDSLFWKPPGSDPVPFHQDGFRVRKFLTPPHMVTCWIALDDCCEELGPLQYAKGSHQWPVSEDPPIEHDEYQYAMRLAAKAAGVNPEVVAVQGSAGTCAFHDGLTWHGSAENVSNNRPRCAMSVHFIAAEARFCAVPTSPLYADYKRSDSDTLDEKNFPIIWTDERSPTLNSAAQDSGRWFVDSATTK
jgi:phytanoyl-CoA hydroxylase